jgi:tetratricopeptide (TPR) repeat protein
MQLKDPKRAVAEYSKALTFNPALASPYFGMAEAYRQLGERERALHFYGRYVQSTGADKNATYVDRASRWMGELQK